MVDCGWDSDITAPLLLEKMRKRYDIPETWSDEDARAVVGFRYEFDLRGITYLPTYTFLEDVSDEHLSALLEIPETWSDEDARAVVGFRYEFDLRGITYLPTYTFLEDVSDEHLSALLELNTPGLMVESSTVREYHTKYAAHVLGYLGGMTDAEWSKFKEDVLGYLGGMTDAEWSKFKEEGYSMDAMVGKTGFEQAFEEYLHGIDGTRVDVVNRNGAIVKQYYADERDENNNIIGKKVPIAGNNVETTIDIKIQQAAEEALEEVMLQIKDPQINTEEGEHTGLDAQGAAVIVMDPRTGEILACASYPTFDLSTMMDKKIWAQINNDELKPLFNRAFGAEYAPGST